METRLTLRPGMPGALLARYGERLVCVRYLYDEARSLRLKTVELVIEEAPWRGRARKPRRNDHDLVGVRIDWHETELRIAVKKTGGIWRPEAEAVGGILGRGANPRHRASSSRRLSTGAAQTRGI